MAEKRSDKVTVIMPEDVIAYNPDKPENLHLNLERTKAYTQELVNRPMGEVWKEVNDQMVSLLLLLREASFKWLEIWTNSVDPRLREEAKHHFTSLNREAANIAEQRQVLAKALGLNVTGEIGQTEADAAPTLYEPEIKMTQEEFERRFKAFIPPPVIADHRTIDKK